MASAFRKNKCIFIEKNKKMVGQDDREIEDLTWQS